MVVLVTYVDNERILVLAQGAAADERSGILVRSQRVAQISSSSRLALRFRRVCDRTRRRK